MFLGLLVTTLLLTFFIRYATISAERLTYQKQRKVSAMTPEEQAEIESQQEWDYQQETLVDERQSFEEALARIFIRFPQADD